MTTTNAQRAYGIAMARLIAWVSQHEVPQMLWLEGPDRNSVRRPLDRIQAHLATDDPRFDELFACRVQLAAALGATITREEDGPLDGKCCVAALSDGLPVELHFERMSLLAKRARSVVSPQVDKTGHLRHVLDYGDSDIPQRLIS